MSNTMQKLLKKKASQLKLLERGQLVQGTVVKNDGRTILVDVGGKSEGIISRREIEEEKIDLSNFAVGDQISVIVNQSETDQGFTVLSIKKAQSEKRWRDAKEAQENDTTIEVKITDINNGGVVASFGSISGFVPISQLSQELFFKVKNFGSNDLRPSDRGLIKQELLNQVIKVKVIEVDRKKNRLVVSQKRAATSKGSKDTAKELGKIKVGATLSGGVTNVTPFGIFVDVGQVEGLVHVSELSWDRVSHPGQLFSPGDKVKVQVISVEPEQGKLSLSIKALTENPWQKFAKDHQVGSVVTGKVVKIVPYGAFINVGASVDAFLHVSESAKPLAVEEEVKAVITEIDQNRKKVSLSAKQLGKQKAAPKKETKGAKETKATKEKGTDKEDTPKTEKKSTVK